MIPPIRFVFDPLDKAIASAKTMTRATPGSAGYDLVADGEYEIAHGHPVFVSTGVTVEIPKHLFGMLTVRSSMGAKGIMLANGVGIIDTDYRGEIRFCLVNLQPSHLPYRIVSGQRIGQLVLLPNYSQSTQAVEVGSVEDLSKTRRGDGGFGSTGE